MVSCHLDGMDLDGVKKLTVRFFKDQQDHRSPALDISKILKLNYRFPKMVEIILIILCN